MNEDLLLSSIFRSSLNIKEEADMKIYEIKFKQRVFEFLCPQSYPSSIPTIRSHLTDEQVDVVYDKAKQLVNKPMIYDLVLLCIKQDELDLNSTVSTSYVVDYDVGDAPRITPEQFFDWVRENQKKPEKGTGKTGKDIFESLN